MQSIKIQFHYFQAVKLLKVNQGTQIQISTSLSHDMQHTHSLIEPPAQIGVNIFLLNKKKLILLKYCQGPRIVWKLGWGWKIQFQNVH